MIQVYVSTIPPLLSTRCVPILYSGNRLNWYEILKLFEPIEIMNIFFVKQHSAMLIFLRMSYLAFGAIERGLNLYTLQ